MTLFVDCINSKFTLMSVGNPPIDSSLFSKDREAFCKHFADESGGFSSVIFKNLPEIGNGFIIFKSTTNSLFIVHIRCTLQDSKSNCLLLKDVSLPASKSFLLPETAKTKAKRILERFNVKPDEKTVLKSISCAKMKKSIKKMDSDLFLNRFKFGVAYLDRFDTTEQQMLSNTMEDSQYSEGFTAFLRGLGDKIDLMGWQGFSGGLDVSEEGLTGQHAIYNKIEDSEVIFHISPWLPQSESYENLQNNNLERKRHFGNDTIVIIYSESLYAFEMESLLSRQNQVVIFVRFINRLQKYQIHVYSKIPALCIKSNPFVIESDDDFEGFTRFLISLERQIYNAHPFEERLTCMRTFHLNQITK